MRIITSQGELEALCADFARAPYVTVDTEFLRERTYWPQLCLIQIARPALAGEAEGAAAIIDPIEGDLDLAPFWALLADEAVTKVFHAARQDVEIFVHLGNVVPVPLADTQIMAMVCGFGDQVGYETLARDLAKARLDKSSRFTDWSRRPLSEKQLRYALEDVTHLRVVYEKLDRRIEKAGRGHWVREEAAILARPETYLVDPEEAWRRIKTRNNAPAFLAIVRELARWREEEARRRDVPRNRVLKDDALLELAALKPRSPADLSKARLAGRERRSEEAVRQLLDVVRRGVEAPADTLPSVPDPLRLSAAQSALGDLLRVLLKAKAAQADVAPRLIAASADLDRIAAGQHERVLALQGWRREVFGEDALALREGRIALTANARGVTVTPLQP